MLLLQPVRLDLEEAVLRFETSNREYFAKSISDRGDSYFLEYSHHHQELLAEHEARTSAFYVLVDERSEVVGRFNLYDIVGGTARVGYRVGEQSSGRGIATSGLRSLCQIARDEFGLFTLTAVATNENVASQRVLLKAGFTYGAPTQVAGSQGASFQMDLMTL